MDVKSISVFVIIVTAIILLAVKTIRDYKILKENKTEGIYINPKSFNWKSGIFIFLAIAMLFYATKKDIYTIILFFCLLGIGCLNLVYVIKIRNFKKRKSED